MSGTGGRITPQLPTGMNTGGPRQSGAQPAGDSRQTVKAWPTLLLFLVVTWLAAGGLKVLQPVTHVPTEVLSLTQFAPSIAVLVMLATGRGAGLSMWQGTAVATLRRIAVGAAILVAVFGTCLAGLALIGHTIHLTSLGSLGEPFWLIAAAQLIGACGEELGWRSFLQPHLQQRYSPVASALIVGVLWGTWHVEYFSDGLLFVATFVVMAVAISVILAELIRGVSSFAVAGVFHWLLNLAILLLLNFTTGNLTETAALAASFVVAAVVVCGYARLRRGPSRERFLAGGDGLG